MDGATSGWARERFGDAAPELRLAVTTAIPQAHRHAVTAQVGAGTRKKDPYGHTMKVRQHECLVAAAQDVPGVEVVHPKGAAFELVRVRQTGVLLFPWRYATDGRTPRQRARMRPEGLRYGLLSGPGQGMGQLTIDDAELDAEQLDARLADEAELLQQLREAARIVVVGYASDPSTLFDLGWGDADVDETGTVHWTSWEPLSPSTAEATALRTTVHGNALRPVDVASEQVLRLIKPVPAGAAAQPRFDAAPLVQDFGLRARPQLQEEPLQEAAAERPETGTGDEQP
jgi:hypothetical protein